MTNELHVIWTVTNLSLERLFSCGLWEALERYDLELPATEVGVPVTAEMVGEIEAVAGYPILLTGLLSPGCTATPGDSAEATAAVLVFERETHVTVGEDAWRGQELGTACDEDGVRVAVAEGCKLLESAEEVRRDLGEVKLEIEAQLFGGGRQAELIGSDVGERVSELRHVSGG